MTALPSPFILAPVNPVSSPFFDPNIGTLCLQHADSVYNEQTVANWGRQYLQTTMCTDRLSGTFLGKDAFSPQILALRVYNMPSVSKISRPCLLGAVDNRLQFLGFMGKWVGCTGKRSGIQCKIRIFLHIGGLGPHMGRAPFPGGL